MGIRSEKCVVVRTSQSVLSTLYDVRTTTNLDSITYYTPSLYTAYCS